MKHSREKLQKLAHVARRYYLEDWKQIDIARELGVSRPLVSRMLGEARELGVVHITVYEPGEESAVLLDRLRLSTSLQGGVLVEDGRDDDATNQTLSKGAVELLGQLGGEYAPVTQLADTAQDGDCQCILFLRKDFILIQTDVCNEHAALFIV